MKKLLAVTVVLALLVSCNDGSVGGGKGGSSNTGNNSNAPSKNFWAQDITNDTFYQLEAQMLAQNSRCEVWVEKGSGITAAQAKRVASTYSDNIYQKMIDTFSNPINFQLNGVVYPFKNTMDFAHWAITGETSGGKLTILLLNIKDGYVKGVNDAYVAGYFSTRDFLEDNPTYRSNQRDMLYIDIDPLPVDSEHFYRTIAHEMQHLMNFATTFSKRSDYNEIGQITAIRQMDTWIDEGLSSAAEWVYTGKHNQDRIDWFNDNGAFDKNGVRTMSGLIDKGNNFFVWGNRESENEYAVLDDYASVYLFFQWLRLKYGTNTYRNIIISDKADYRAIANDWPTLLQAWLRANYSKSSSGDYGYKSDTVLNSIKVHYAPTGLTSIDLYPGEGVYSYVENTKTVPTSTGDIVYLNASTGATNGSITAEGALLTYNKSTTVTYDNKGKPIATPESGEITGVAGPSTNIISSGGRSVLGGVPSGPFPISAGDMLRRRGYEYDRNFTGMNSLKFLTGAVIE